MTLENEISFKMKSLHEQLEAAGLNILGVSIDKVIQWDGQPTAQELQTADTILQAFDFETFQDVDKNTYVQEYIAMQDRLEQIENATNPTNAQVIAAVRDMAKYQRRVNKLLARLFR